MEKLVPDNKTHEIGHNVPELASFKGDACVVRVVSCRYFLCLSF